MSGIDLDCRTNGRKKSKFGRLMGGGVRTTRGAPHVRHRVLSDIDHPFSLRRRNDYLILSLLDYN